MTQFEIIESLAFYFDEYKSDLEPHWRELIELFNQSSMGLIDEAAIKYSLPYFMCLNQLQEVFLNDK